MQEFISIKKTNKDWLHSHDWQLNNFGSVVYQHKQNVTIFEKNAAYFCGFSHSWDRFVWHMGVNS